MNTQPPSLEFGYRVADNGQEDRLPEPSLFWSSPAHEELLHQVRNLVESTRDIAVLIGRQGVGKTTLVYRLQSSIPAHWRICRVDCNPMMHPDQLLIRLGRCVNAHPVNDGTAEAVEQALARLRQQGQLPVFVLDDAEQLPISSLITLMRLHEQRVESSPICALILLAQAAFDRTLTTHQLHAMGTNRLVRLEMPLLSNEQIGDYIRHFLRVEGVESDLELDAKQLAGIHRDSGGLPGKVNDMVIRALRKPDLRTHSPLAERIKLKIRDIPPMTATATAVVAALLILSTLFQAQINNLFQQSEPEQQQPLEPTTTVESTYPGEPTMDAKAVHKTPRPQSLTLPPQSGISQSAELEMDPPAQSGEHRESAALSTAVAQKPAQSETSRHPPAAIRITEPVETTQNGTTPEVSATTETEPRPKRAAWLLKQDPDAYSLQILAAGSEAAVQRFLRQHGLDRDVYYFESRRKGLPWFAVLHGIYKDRGTAVSALNQLPESLRKAGAWPRTLSSIQKEIRQVR